MNSAVTSMASASPNGLAFLTSKSLRQAKRRTNIALDSKRSRSVPRDLSLATRVGQR